MALTKEEWLKSYEHRFDKRKYKPKIDLNGNKFYLKNYKRRTALKTPDWILKGGALPKNIEYDSKSDTYTKIRKRYKKRGRKVRKARLARTERPSNNEPASINDIC